MVFVFCLLSTLFWAFVSFAVQCEGPLFAQIGLCVGLNFYFLHRIYDKYAKTTLKNKQVALFFLCSGCIFFVGCSVYKEFFWRRENVFNLVVMCLIVSLYSFMCVVSNDSVKESRLKHKTGG